MLRSVGVILCVFVILTGCRKAKLPTGAHPQELVGSWELSIGSSCEDYGVAADTLILHPDGTFDQHLRLTNGKRLDVTGQHWQYDAVEDGGSIALDKRLEFFTPEHSNRHVADGVATFEVLIMKFNPQPEILLHPDSDCAYEKKESN